MDMGDAEQSQDLLGRTYEYCIAQFAEKEGKGGGEFYTPASVVKTLVEILKPFSNCRVYESKTQNLIQINDCPLRGVA
jgi:type I restriction enzyme M protein